MSGAVAVGRAEEPGHLRHPVVMATAAGGGRRSLVVAATTSVVCGLLLVAASVLRLPGHDLYGYDGGERLWQPVAEPGTRVGVIIAIVLMQLPLLLLLDQAVRLGSTARQRRYAALAVAGAARRDLRRWSMLEVGVPAAAGAVLGVPVWWLLREVLGRALLAAGHPALVPTETGPGPWALLVIALVAGYGLLVGRRAAAVVGSPLTRSRGLRRPPRPWWGLLALFASLYGIPRFGYTFVGRFSELGFYVSLLLLPVGVAALSPWLAHLSAKAVGRLASTVPTLLAARRLAADARPAGRAAAAIGAVSLVVGVATSYSLDVLRSYGHGIENRSVYLTPAFVIVGCAAAAVLVIGASLAIHTVETVLERRREMAALVASGIPADRLAVSQCTECLIATVPLTVLGGLLGGVGYGWARSAEGTTYALVALVTAALVALVALAVAVTTRLLRPWVVEAVSTGALRTE